MNRRKTGYAIGTLALLVYAYVAKEAARNIENIFLETIVQFSRHLIHISLVFMWMISVRQRIMQKKVRQYLLAVGALVVFWLYVRTCKWMFFSSDLVAKRYLWYTYYIPMVLIPLFGVFILSYLGKEEYYEMPSRMRLLYLPAVFLILAVFTNDFHQLVFRFPEGQPFSDEQYTYGILYMAVLGWDILLGLYYMIGLLRRFRIPSRGWIGKLPLFVLAAALVFTALYCLQIIIYDLAAVDCGFIILLLESCIQSGMIRSNSNFELLFEISDIEAQITDRDGKIYCSSGSISAPQAHARKMVTDLEHMGTILEGKKLSGDEITNGRVFWWEDISQILSYTEKLEKTGARLSEKNELLKSELILKEKQLHITEKNRLYDQVAGEISVWLDRLEELLQSSAECDANRIAQICVLSAYIKRRSNLRLLAENSDQMEAKELEFCILESVESIRLYGRSCSFRSECHGMIDATAMIACYDAFGEIVWHILKQTDSLLLDLHADAQGIRLRMQMDHPKKKALPELPTVWREAGGVCRVYEGEDMRRIELCMNKSKSGLGIFSGNI